MTVLGFNQVKVPIDPLSSKVHTVPTSSTDIVVNAVLIRVILEMALS